MKRTKVNHKKKRRNKENMSSTSSVSRTTTTNARVPPLSTKKYAHRRARTFASKTTQKSSPTPMVTMCDVLSDEEFNSWVTSKALVMELGFDDEKAEEKMQQAFGWIGQNYWRNEKVREIPKVDDIEANFQFLESEIGLSRDQNLDVVIENMPELLAMNMNVMKEAVQHIEKNFFMKRGSKALAKYILRVPQALGNTIDCEGTCAGECNRCWVRV